MMSSQFSIMQQCCEVVWYGRRRGVFLEVDALHLHFQTVQARGITLDWFQQ